MSDAVRVALGIVRDDEGRVLVARRAGHRHQGGGWEFPGGKLAAGEPVETALRRELAEEVGVQVETARPLIRIHHDYADVRVVLDVWQVQQWRGPAQGREGQAIDWVPPGRLPALAMPAANRAIVHALNLPPLYLISPEPKRVDGFLQRLETILQAGLPLFQLRIKQQSLAASRSLIDAALALCSRYDATLVLNGDPETARQIGAGGVHLSSQTLMQQRHRPLPADCLVGASCHTPAELEQAVAIEADFALLSPVQATGSHPDIEPLGWAAFARYIETINMPVYALGGMQATDIPVAWQHGGQGIAMLSAVWDAADPGQLVRQCLASI